MALKLVRKKKQKAATASGKKSQVDKFIDAIDRQLRIARGERVMKGRGVAKSWMEDGASYGEDKVLKPRVGIKFLNPKSAIRVDTKQPDPPTAELTELREMATAGKLTVKIGKAGATEKKKA